MVGGLPFPGLEFVPELPFDPEFPLVFDPLPGPLPKPDPGLPKPDPELFPNPEPEVFPKPDPELLPKLLPKGLVVVPFCGMTPCPVLPPKPPRSA